jgi:hypothetical protein
VLHGYFSDKDKLSEGSEKTKLYFPAIIFRGDSTFVRNDKSESNVLPFHKLSIFYTFHSLNESKKNFHLSKHLERNQRLFKFTATTPAL